MWGGGWAVVLSDAVVLGTRVKVDGVEDTTDLIKTKAVDKKVSERDKGQTFAWQRGGQ